MGEAKHNPRSTQYVDPNPPKYKVGAMVDVIAEPTEAWKKANPAKEGESNYALCPEEDMEAVFVVYGFYAENSAVVRRPQDIPQGHAKFFELGRVPWKSYQRVIKANNPGVAWFSDMEPKPSIIGGLDS